MLALVVEDDSRAELGLRGSWGEVILRGQRSSSSTAAPFSLSCQEYGFSGMKDDREQSLGPAAPTGGSTASLFARFQARYAFSRSSRSPPPLPPPPAGRVTTDNARCSLTSEGIVAEEHGDGVREELGVELERSGSGDGLKEATGASQEMQMSTCPQGDFERRGIGGGTTDLASTAMISTSLPCLATTSESAAQEAPPSAADVDQTLPGAVSALSSAQPRAYPHRFPGLITEILAQVSCACKTVVQVFR